MIELRWRVSPVAGASNKKLQYRKVILNDEFEAEWSEWEDTPTVLEEYGTSNEGHHPTNGSD